MTLLNLNKSLSVVRIRYTNHGPHPGRHERGPSHHLLLHAEGIYGGYKFYETAAAEDFIDYDKVVQSPFGRGLSYTTFTQTMSDLSVANGEITFDVTVTNTGSTAGKDMSSFDELGEGCYVLEQGDYIISVNANSHEMLDNKTYHQDSNVVYNEGNPRASDDTAAAARFGDLRSDVTYLSRRDGFTNYGQATVIACTWSPELATRYG